MLTMLAQVKVKETVGLRCEHISQGLALVVLEAFVRLAKVGRAPTARQAPRHVPLMAQRPSANACVDKVLGGRGGGTMMTLDQSMGITEMLVTAVAATTDNAVVLTAQGP